MMNVSNNASTQQPPNITTVIATIDPNLQKTNNNNGNSVVRHTRTISIVSQSTLNQIGNCSDNEMYMTPRSVRHQVSQHENSGFMHSRSMSDTSFFSIMSEKGNKNVTVDGGFINNGYITDFGNMVITPVHSTTGRTTCS